jgi:hypothetical protein
MLEDPITELTIAMEIDYFQLNRAEYFVPIIVKIPGRELALAKRGGAQYTRMDFVGEVKDLVGGTTVSNVRDNKNMKLSDQTAAELAKRPIEYDTGFTLLPGKYSIKFLARDDETGRIGTYQTTFVIPNRDQRNGKDQGSRERGCGRSAGSRRQAADSQRDARVWRGASHIRLSPDVQTKSARGALSACRDNNGAHAALRLCHALPGRQKGV